MAAARTCSNHTQPSIDLQSMLRHPVSLPTGAAPAPPQPTEIVVRVVAGAGVGGLDDDRLAGVPARAVAINVFTCSTIAVKVCAEHVS